MKILRTPDERFANLPDYPFAAQYFQVTPDLRLHYVDEGPRGAKPVLMLHGEPTWSYLYRKMIPPVAAAGYRVLAPDLIGFGKSDKPSLKSDHSYAAQVGWIKTWIEALDLRDITLVCQDWGSLIGLRLVAENQDRFARVILSNGGLPEGARFSAAFNLWRAFSRLSPWFPIARIVQVGTKRKLSPAELDAYDAPFPTGQLTAGPRIYPSLVPVTLNDPAVPDQKRAWAVFEQWTKPFICCFSDGDPITGGGDQQIRERIPGAANYANQTLRGGHFIQEDDPKAFAQIVIEACRAAEPSLR